MSAASQGGEFHRLPADAAGEVASRAVEGFHLQTAWLFQGPAFPSSLEIVQSLLTDG